MPENLTFDTIKLRVHSKGSEEEKSRQETETVPSAIPEVLRSKSERDCLVSGPHNRCWDFFLRSGAEWKYFSPFKGFIDVAYFLHLRVYPPVDLGK